VADLKRWAKMKIIVSGIPCSGKTRFADWLRDVHGFTHVNLEDPSLYASHVIGPSLGQGFPCWLSGTSTKIVVSWGFPPEGECFTLIRAFADSGFTPWWFDAPLELARSRYVARDGEGRAKQFFDPQAEKITAEKSRLAALYGANRVTTLTADGYLAAVSLLKVITPT
jgi:hypothetical protein